MDNDDVDENDDEDKYFQNILKIAEGAGRLSQLGSGSFVFSKLHRSLFIVRKHLLV